MNELISVIISTYNREDALDATLRALSRQSDRNFEIIVADDGSGPATAAVVRRWGAAAAVPVKHVWHEDRGFRLAEIRNRGILASAGRYVIFLDGDCLARRRFVAAHRRLAEPGWFVTGSRILLAADLSQHILACGQEAETWDVGRWLRQRLRGRINRLAPLFNLPLGALRKAGARRWRGARGSNMAFWRSDLDRVDGFDASFSGWGREDSDMFIRLIRAGIRRKDARHAGTVLHLWHREADRTQLADNERQLGSILASERIAALRGLSSLHELAARAQPPEGSP